MVEVRMADIFESKAQTLVNTVNRVGVMGKGIALGFKTRFPDMYADYVARCKLQQVTLGEPYLYRTLFPPWVLNFPTKDHWRSVARLDDIVSGLRYIVGHYKSWGITSLAVPPLGCGEGQLEWSVVGPTLFRYLDQLEIPVELYAPYGTPTAQLQMRFLTQLPELGHYGSSQGRIKPEWIALVEILARIESEPYHWPVGRTTLQKIAYFATESGLATDLSHSRGSFGPYSPNLKARITQLVNNGLIVEERRGQMFEARTGPTFQDARTVYNAAISGSEPIIERVSDLFLRMNTRQSEIAATVHFADKALISELGRLPSEMEVLAYALEWKQRRQPPLDRTEIAQAIRNLAVLRWINVSPSNDLPLPEDAVLDF